VPPPPGFILYSHARLRAAQLSATPVIKGVPELSPLLRPGSALKGAALGLRVAGDKGGAAAR
jgi:hypothetical protein